MSPFEHLAKHLEKAQRTWSVSWRLLGWQPPQYSGDLTHWLDEVLDRLAAEQVAFVDLEDLRTVFGGCAWERAEGDPLLAKEIVTAVDALFDVLLTRRGMTLLHAARHLLEPGDVVEIDALNNAGAQLGFSRRETEAILWAVAHRARFRWLMVWYQASAAGTGDFRDDLQIVGYQLTPDGKAALSR